MEITETIARIRDMYVTQFMEAVVATSKSATPFASELLIELNSSSRTGVCRLYRIDMISGPPENPRLYDFCSDTYVSFEPFDFNFGQLAVQIRPFYWSSAELRCHSVHSPQAPLETWAERWLDIECKRRPNGDGSLGAIHSIGESVQDGHAWSTSIDFGTAPPDAFWDCLSVLETMSAKRIVVETPGMSDGDNSK
jgi:hypothetical protein